MIMVRLMGGLGNQMFQYAAGRSLALQLGVPLTLDISFYDQCQGNTTLRQYALGDFNIQATLARPDELLQMAPTATRIDRITLKVKQCLGLASSPARCYHEPHFQHDPMLCQQPDNSYLIGFWQSERYFKDYSDCLVKEFSCRHPMDTANLATAREIDQTESIAVHIRRGDYVSNPETSSYHGVCSLEYYQQAISLVARYFKNPHFFLFTDDPDWVADSFQVGWPTTLVTCNQAGHAINDLRLISRCRHAIIANSSFSWWGGWLNRNPEKCVIAPRRWFAKPELNTADLIPPDWITL